MDIFAVIDTYPDQLMYPLMTVLNTLVHAIRRWYPCDKNTGGPREVASAVGEERVQQVRNTINRESFSSSSKFNNNIKLIIQGI